MTTAILDIRPAARLAPTVQSDATALIHRLRLDRLPARRPLLCRWERDADGRLSCFWEPDIALGAHR